jgi:hypothetical protein
MTEREYRYPKRGGRRARPPRGFAFCKVCRAKVRVLYVDGRGLCESCTDQLPMFELDDLEQPK